MAINSLAKTTLAAAIVSGLVGLTPTTTVYASGITDGMPHMLWRYTFRDNGDRYNPLAERHYLTCTYVGPHGEITVPAENGRCAWLKRFGNEPQGVIRHRR